MYSGNPAVVTLTTNGTQSVGELLGIAVVDGWYDIDGIGDGCGETLGPNEREGSRESDGWEEGCLDGWTLGSDDGCGEMLGFVDGCDVGCVDKLGASLG